MKLDCTAFLERFRKCPAGTALLLDVRNDDEVAQGILRGAVHIPLPQLETRLNELPREKSVFIYCRSGGRALVASQLLRTAGFQNVIVADGGGYEKLSAG
jgi:rhodanese-related sulfurtransferase